MRNGLFVAMLLVMISVTIWATQDRSLFDAGAELMHFPWFIATLTDAYLAFIAFYICVILRNTPSTARRAAWLVAVLCLGSIAIAIYALLHRHQRTQQAGR